MSKLTIVMTVPDYETGTAVWAEVGPALGDLLTEGPYKVEIDGVVIEDVTEAAQ